LAGAGLAPARVDLAPLPAWNLLPATRDDQALVVADGGESALALRRGGRLAGLRPLGASAREPAALASEVRWSLAPLGRALAAEAAAALPGARLVAPRAQLEAAAAAATRRAARLGGETGPLEVLRELSARVPPALRLDLDELAVERDSVLLHGRAESFDAVDALRRALSASPLLADVTAGETRTTVDGR